MQRTAQPRPNPFSDATNVVTPRRCTPVHNRDLSTQASPQTPPKPRQLRLSSPQPNLWSHQQTCELNEELLAANTKLETELGELNAKLATFSKMETELGELKKNLEEHIMTAAMKAFESMIELQDEP